MNKLWIVLAAASLAALPAREEVSKDFSRDLTLTAGQRVSVENRNGDVAIRGASGTAASIRAFIRVSAAERATAEQFANAITIDVTNGAGELRVNVRYPERPEPGGFLQRIFGGANLGYSVRLELAIPDTSPLHVRNAFGRVEVDDMKAGASLLNSNGDVTVRRARGDQRVETQFGRIQVNRIVGSVNALNNNGDINISEVTGNVTARGKFGAMDVQRISGTVDVQNGNQSVMVIDVGGRTTIGTSFGGVTATRIKADVVVRNDNGAVDLTEIAGSADVTTKFGNVRFAKIGRGLLVRNDNGAVEGHDTGAGATVVSSFGPVRLTDIQGDVSVKNDNGAISVSTVSGGANLRTKFGPIDASGVRNAVVAVNDNGPVTITDAQSGVTASSKFAGVKLVRVAGPVDVTNDNGGITALGLRRVNPKVCEPIRMSTKFSAIKVEIPPGADYDLDATTKFGGIHSDVTVSSQGERKEHALIGKIGRGGCELRLTNDNGGIHISAAQNESPARAPR